MEASRALGLWRSTFGAVKIEADSSQGGIGAGAVQGVWVYQRQGQEVVGYFSGNLRGNVLQFRWQEPNDPPLTGEGYLVFDAQGRQYNGRWWSDRRDRVGDWNGWRASGRQNARAPQPYSGDRSARDGQSPPDGQYAPEEPSGEEGLDEGQDPRYAPPPPPRRDAYRRGQPYPQQQTYPQPNRPYPQQQTYPPPPAQQPYR